MYLKLVVVVSVAVVIVVEVVVIIMVKIFILLSTWINDRIVTPRHRGLGG